MLISSEGEELVEGAEIAICLNGIFFEIFTKKSIDLPHPIFNSRTPNLCAPDSSFLSEGNIRVILVSLNHRKSVGIDKVYPRVLSECAISCSQPFSVIFKSSFTQGKLPGKWKMANIKPFYKKGRKTDRFNYRSICFNAIPS